MSLLDSINLRQSSAHALRSGTAVQKEEDGRVCGAPDCTTRLSRYNPATTCCQHEGWEDPQPTRGRR